MTRPPENLQAEQLARWLAGPLTGDADAGLDADVVEAVIALRPERAAPSRVTLDDILSELEVGPLAVAPSAEERAEAAELAALLDGDGAIDPASPALEALVALRPELAAPPRVALDDILGDITTGPFAAPMAQVIDLAAERRSPSRQPPSSQTAAPQATAPQAAALQATAPQAAAPQAAARQNVASRKPARRTLAHRTLARRALPWVGAFAAAALALVVVLPMDPSRPALTQPVSGPDAPAASAPAKAAREAHIPELKRSERPADRQLAKDRSSALKPSASEPEAPPSPRASPRPAQDPVSRGPAPRRASSATHSGSPVEQSAAGASSIGASAAEALDAFGMGGFATDGVGAARSSEDMYAAGSYPGDITAGGVAAGNRNAGRSGGQAPMVEAMLGDQARDTPRSIAPEADATALTLTAGGGLERLRERANLVPPAPDYGQHHPEVADVLEAARRASTASDAADLLSPLLSHADPDLGMDAARRIAWRFLQEGDSVMALTYIARGLGIRNGSANARRRLLVLQGQVLEHRADAAGAMQSYEQALQAH